MKYLLPLSAIALAAYAVAAGTPPKPSLPAVKGQFSCPATFQLATEQPDNGVLAAQARTTKSGSTMTIRLTGVVDPSDTPVPVDVTLRFNRNKRTVTATSFMMGYYGPMNTAKSMFKQKKRTLTFMLSSGAGGASIQGTPIDGAVVYECKFRRRALSITGAGFIHVPPSAELYPYVVNITGTRVP
jgi:hypothetical protein